jgi:hypothetical protein
MCDARDPLDGMLSTVAAERSQGNRQFGDIREAIDAILLQAPCHDGLQLRWHRTVSAGHRGARLGRYTCTDLSEGTSHKRNHSDDELEQDDAKRPDIAAYVHVA